MGFKDLRKLIQPQTKSTKRAIIVLPAIVVGTTALVIVLRAIVPPDYDIPNWMTMIVELGIGSFIAALIFIMQEKTSDSLLAYNEEQKRLLRSLRLHSLKRIEYYLSMAQDIIDFDKDRIDAQMDKTQQLNFVDNLLSGHHDRFSDRAPHVVDQLQTEYNFVRPLVARIELEENLRSLIDKIQLLYGLSPGNKVQKADFPLGNKVDNWFALYDWASRLIKKTKELIQEIQSAENDKASSAKE